MAAQGAPILVAQQNFQREQRMKPFDLSAATFLTSASIFCAACSSVPMDGDATSDVDSAQEELRHAGPPCALAHADDEGRVTDLGFFDSAPYGLRYSFAQAVNDRKTVVGHALTQVSPELNQQHAFRWKPRTGMVDLGTLAGGFYSIATDVNDRDQVVGNADLPGGNQHAVLWDARGRIRDLGTLGGDSSYAYKINNRGQVLGSSTNTDNEFRVFIWEAQTGMVELDLPGVSYASLTGFNDSGVIVGGWVKEGSSYTMPFRWTKSEGGTELDLLGGSRGEATAINEQGDIVGFIYDTKVVAVKWSGTRAVRLRSLPDREEHYPIGQIESFPRAINRRGFIAGSDTTDSDLTAIQWTSPNHVERLPLGAIQSDAFDLNNRGDIVGGYFAAGMADWHGFLWEPRGH